MRKIVLAVVFLVVACVSSGFAQSQVTPQQLSAQAFEKIKVASDLFKRGEELLAPPATKERLAASLQIYIQAGKLFEEAGNALKSLAPQYANQSDADNCFTAVQTCLDTIAKIRAVLQK